MQVISTAELKQACRLAYREGRLLAQHPKLSLAYKNGEYRCAIGAAMNETTLTEVDRRGLKDGAVTEGIIKFTRLSTARAIMDAHDAWRNGGSEDKFKLLIR